LAVPAVLRWSRCSVPRPPRLTPSIRRSKTDERPKIADALRTIARELPTALELLASELEARAAAPTAPAASEMVTVATFARERSLNPATVRRMAKDGLIAAAVALAFSSARRPGGGSNLEPRALAMARRRSRWW